MLIEWKKQSEETASLEIETSISSSIRGAPSKLSAPINWHQISQFRPEEQQRLTTNFLTRDQGIAHCLDPVYVSLGLVKRKKLSSRQDDIAPEEGSKLYREIEISQTFEHEQFLDQVFRQKQSSESKGQRISIIGEPGAGKTTLLQQIAQCNSPDNFLNGFTRLSGLTVPGPRYFFKVSSTPDFDNKILSTVESGFEAQTLLKFCPEYCLIRFQKNGL